MKIMMRLLMVLAAVVCALVAGPALAAPGETQQTQTTDHYKIILTLGSTATMLMPEQAAGAKAGEVMVQMPGMAMPTMSMTDQGQAVNHHLEVAVFDKTSGAVVADQMPTITIKNDATGASRSLDSVMAMYDVQVGKSDMHFGNNVYLPDGAYTITAAVNGETAIFANVTIGAGANMAGGSMAGGSMAGSTMPATGVPTTDVPAILFAIAILILTAGVLLRRPRRA